MLKFKTENNQYAWDEELAMFVPFNQPLDSIFKAVCENNFSKEDCLNVFGSEFKDSEIVFCYDWSIKWSSFQEKIINQYQIISKDIIKSEILKSGLNGLILGVTEECNLRCKYCSYSGIYPFSRTHSDQYMSFETSKKAISYYLDLIIKGIKYNPIRKPVIGFYGGEPLLNFNLIKKSVEFIKEKYGEKFNKTIEYTITTNGTLLSETKLKWLIKNNFTIYLSLDGSEKNQDRNRVYKDGSKTFKDIEKNLNYLFNNPYEKFYVIPVYDWKTDLFENQEFFDNSSLFNVLSASIVNYDENYYSQFSTDDHDAFKNSLLEIMDIYFNKLKKSERINSFFYYLFMENIEKDIFGNNCALPSNPIIKCTGTCVPGKKLFVDVNGDFYACERVNKSFSIGNVDEGFNLENIKCLLDEYFYAMDKCDTCKIRKKCELCFQNFETNEKCFLNSSEVCSLEEESNISDFIVALSYAETYPEIIEENYENQNLKKFL